MPILNTNSREIYQTSIMSALIAGVTEGEVTFRELARYGDFGLGTFNDLDGEMIGFDGKFYQLRSDGTATAVHPYQKTPFAAVCFFKAEIVRDVTAPLTRKEFQELMDILVKTKNLFFAIRVDGFFANVTTRTVSKRQEPARGLAEAAEDQSTFTFSNTQGTLVGYRSPDYAQGLTVAGYHLHFLNEAKTGGGHVLDFILSKGSIGIDHYSSIFVALPETSQFEKAKIGKPDDDAIKRAEG
jgi:acetolactate decarboxylase